jgi:hypothetical protein
VSSSWTAVMSCEHGRLKARDRSMALVKCKDCGQEVSTDAKQCPNCGSTKFLPWTKNPTANGIAGVALLIFFGWCGVKVCNGSPEKPTAQATPAPSAPWTGPAAWVADFKKLVKNPKGIKPYSTTRDDDGPLAVYDFKSYQDGATGMMARVDGKPAAWRWQFAACGTSPADLVRPEDLEILFETRTHEKWYRIKAGDLQNTYVGFKPSYMPPQALLTVETAEYAEAVNETALQPWLCTNNRVAGKQGLKEEVIIVRCQHLVKENLRSPSSADFQGLFDGIESPSYFGNCDAEWASWVEAKNAFGVPIRKRFKCRYSARTGKLTARLQE